MAVSFNMIQDALLQQKCVFFPFDASKRFKALVLPGQSISGFADDELLLLDDDQAATLAALQERSELHAVCVLTDDEPQLEQLAATGRCLGIRCGQGLAGVVAPLSSLFQEVSAWESTLQRILLEGGSYSDLLDASTGIIPCPMVMSGVGLQIVAYTHELLPPEDIIVSALERGYFDESAAAHFQSENFASLWEDIEGVTLVEKTTELRDYPIIFYVFRVHGNYYLHLVVHLIGQAMTAGFEDRLQVLIDAIELKVQANPPSETLFEESASAVLADCIKGDMLINRRAVNAFKDKGFREGDRYRIYALEYRLQPSERQIAASYAIELMGQLPDSVIALIGAQVVFMVHDCDVTERLIEFLGRHLSRHAGIALYSDVMATLVDVRYAYLQTVAGLEAAASFAYEHGGVFSFAAAFPDYLLIKGLADREFLDAVLARSWAKRLLDEDALKDGDDASLLRTFLECERRVGPAADALFIHRNTLTYRIQRLEERMSLSLEAPEVRKRLLLEFRLLDLKA